MNYMVFASWFHEALYKPSSPQAFPHCGDKRRHSRQSIPAELAVCEFQVTKKLLDFTQAGKALGFQAWNRISKLSKNRGLVIATMLVNVHGRC